MKPLEDVRKLQSRPQAYGTPQAEEIGPEASDKVLSDSEVALEDHLPTSGLPYDVLVENPHHSGQRVRYGVHDEEYGRQYFGAFALSPQDIKQLQSWRVYAQQSLSPMPAYLVQSWWYRTGNNFITMAVKPLRDMYLALECHSLAHVRDARLESTLKYLVDITSKADRREVIQARRTVGRYLVQRQYFILLKALSQIGIQERNLIGNYIYGNQEGLRMRPPTERCRACHEFASRKEAATPAREHEQQSYYAHGADYTPGGMWLAEADADPMLAKVGIMFAHWAVLRSQDAVDKACVRAEQQKQRLVDMVTLYNRLERLDAEVQDGRGARYGNI